MGGPERIGNCSNGLESVRMNLGGAPMRAPPTCSGPDASFFDGVGDSNYPSRMGQLSTQSGP